MILPCRVVAHHEVAAIRLWATWTLEALIDVLTNQP